MAKLFIHIAVRDVTTRRHVVVVDCHTIFKAARNVARMAKTCKILGTRLDHRDLGKDRNTVVTLLSARNHVRVAKRFKTSRGNFLNGRFTLLQTQHIWRLLREQFKHQILAQAH